GAGVGYDYRHNDGLHITFSDDAGFNAVVIRGGIKARLLRDVQKYDDPTSGTLIQEFPGHATTSRAWFDAPVKTRQVSFFDASDGRIADCSFFRVQHGSKLKAESLPTTQPAPQGEVHEISLTTNPLTEE